jgi:hypothetical protein
MRSEAKSEPPHAIDPHMRRNRLTLAAGVAVCHTYHVNLPQQRLPEQLTERRARLLVAPRALLPQRSLVQPQVRRLLRLLRRPFTGVLRRRILHIIRDPTEADHPLATPPYRLRNGFVTVITSKLGDLSPLSCVDSSHIRIFCELVTISDALANKANLNWQCQKIQRPQAGRGCTLEFSVSSPYEYMCTPRQTNPALNPYGVHPTGGRFSFLQHQAPVCFSLHICEVCIGK